MTKKTPSKKESLVGTLAFGREGDKPFAADQALLLLAIQEHGSISKAAKAVGISYKTAWDRIEAINNLSPSPLVARAAGGARGGGTELTEYGQQVLAGFQALQTEHQTFLNRLNNKVQSLNDVAHFMKVGTLNTSARNQFHGIVVAVTKGAVNVELSIKISDTQTLVAQVTEDSRRQLKLKKGSPVIALIKSTWVILSPDPELRSSARNKIRGKITRIHPGAVNSDITLDIGDNKSLSAVITKASAEELALKQGQEVCALFKASSIILVGV